ncbi:tpr repeat-containing protein [Stylonychia lemnae]|uniref:Tpr repeat-containing protein n=1 Tax=Stylonychia lemnae TaxID=5949 RepID=A0A077ZYB2_STYLE|nr:tpr repeat-containing protein [Stylonychia lemnae]|eukprot:CDW73541.1 tpr repeat-containing protein [Stylonychia lemnae]
MESQNQTLTDDPKIEEEHKQPQAEQDNVSNEHSQKHELTPGQDNQIQQEDRAKLTQNTSDVQSLYLPMKVKSKELFKQSRYIEALEFAQQYMKDNKVEELKDVEQRCQIFARYVKCVGKTQSILKASQVLVTEIKHYFDLAQDNPRAKARIIYAQSILEVRVHIVDFLRSINQISELHKSHPNDLVVSKFYVKILVCSPKDGVIELKQCLQYLNQAIKINNQVLNKENNYKKLNLKILLTQCKHFSHLYKQNDYQNLLSQAMRDAGTKSMNSPNVLFLMADFNSKKGDQEKGIQYINRALNLAKEVLDGLSAHKKIIGLLFGKIQILNRKKAFAESLQVTEECGEMILKVFGNDENQYFLTNLNLKASIYADMKGEEYKAEDVMKNASKIIDKIHGSLPNKQESIFNCIFYMEQCANYIKLMRPDKVQKIYKTCSKELMEKGLEYSQIKLGYDFLLLQVQQDPEQAVQLMENVVKLSDKIDQQQGFKGSLSILCDQIKANLKIKEGDLQGGLDVLQETIKMSLEYFDGNEDNELLVDPLIFIGQIYTELDKIPQAIQALIRAEKIVKALSGEISDKLLDIYQQLSTLMVFDQKFEKAVEYTIIKTELAGKIHGQQSEQYCQHLEDQAALFTQMRWLEQAIPLWEKLIRITKEINGGENSQKMIQFYQALAEIFIVLKKNTEALLLTQKVITIYKALNGQEVEDQSLGQLIAQCAFLHKNLNKFNDAISLLDEALRIFKKLQATDQAAKRMHGVYTMERIKFVREKKEYDKQFTKPILQRVVPDTPLKVAIWTTVLASLAGVATYVIMKKREASS